MSGEGTNNDGDKELPDGGKVAKISRGALQAASGLIPFAGGVFSALAGAWSEKEQEGVNKFFKFWIQGLEDELHEKEATLIEIMARLDLGEKGGQARITSRYWL